MSPRSQIRRLSPARKTIEPWFPFKIQNTFYVITRNWWRFVVGLFFDNRSRILWCLSLLEICLYAKMLNRALGRRVKGWQIEAAPDVITSCHSLSFWFDIRQQNVVQIARVSSEMFRVLPVCRFSVSLQPRCLHTNSFLTSFFFCHVTILVPYIISDALLSLIMRSFNDNVVGRKFMFIFVILLQPEKPLVGWPLWWNRFARMGN